MSLNDRAEDSMAGKTIELKEKESASVEFNIEMF